MDPLTITGTVITASRLCLGTARGLYALRDRYRYADATILAIHSELVVVAAYLGRLQVLLTQSPSTVLSQFHEQPELREVCENALLSCTAVYSRLDAEVQKLRQNPTNAGEVNRMERARYLWKEGTMKELLLSIRGQNAAISSLLQCFQMESIGNIQLQVENLHRLMVANNPSVVASGVVLSLPDTATSNANVDTAISTLNDAMHYGREPAVGVVIRPSSPSQSLTSVETVLHRPDDCDENASTAGLAPSTIIRIRRYSPIRTHISGDMLNEQEISDTTSMHIAEEEVIEQETSDAASMHVAEEEMIEQEISDTASTRSSLPLSLRIARRRRPMKLSLRQRSSNIDLPRRSGICLQSIEDNLELRSDEDPADEGYGTDSDIASLASLPGDDLYGSRIFIADTNFDHLNTKDADLLDSFISEAEDFSADRPIVVYGAQAFSSSMLTFDEDTGSVVRSRSPTQHQDGGFIEDSRVTLNSGSIVLVEKAVGRFTQQGSCINLRSRSRLKHRPSSSFSNQKAPLTLASLERHCVSPQAQPM